MKKDLKTGKKKAITETEFKDIIRFAAQPVQEPSQKGKKHHGGYSGKKTRSHSFEDTSPRVAKVEDYYKILNSIPDNQDPRHIRNKVLIMLFKDTGMRLGELLSLNLGDLDIFKMQAVIRTEKTKKLHPIRKVFWTAPTNDALIKWLAKRATLNIVDKDAVFVSCTGVKMGLRLGKSGVTEIMRKMSHTANLDYTVNPHSFRHLFGHDLAKKKVNNSTISTMLGHASPQSSYLYTMLNEEEMAEVYKELRSE